MEIIKTVIRAKTIDVAEKLNKLSIKNRSNLQIEFICESCAKIISISAEAFRKKISLSCGHCSQAKKLRAIIAKDRDAHIQKWKKAIIDKFGVDNIAYSKEIQKEKKKTNMKKYGVEHAISAPNVRKKIEQTFMNKYGVKAPGSIKEVQNRIKESHIEKFGGWYMGTDEFRKRTLQSNKERLGVEYPSQSKEVNDKKHLTNMKKYGVKETFSSPEVKQKRKDTMMKIHGAEYPMQSPTLKREMLRKAGHRRIGGFKGYEYEGKSFDSSYELAYYLWLVHLKKPFVYHPDTPLSYVGSDSKEHLFMPDFLVEGKFYEIKGGCFFNKEGQPFNQYTKEFWWEKYDAIKDNGVIILREPDLKEAMEFVKKQYGKNFLKECKIQPKKIPLE